MPVIRTARAHGGVSRTFLAAAMLARALLGAGALSRAASARAAVVPRIAHLVIIVMENENAKESFSATSPAPYLGETMRAEGAYLPNYYGIGHQSLDNYLALISGQPPSLSTQADCLIYSEMVATSILPNGVAVGRG
ncbi:MAG TPA: hypothetical protein VJ204_04630 [Solirubrobacterales bacterium]|nr:hypothetical protein [Solirubrobacterales bacterium]